MQGLGDRWGLSRKDDKERFKFPGVNLRMLFYKVSLNFKIICPRSFIIYCLLRLDIRVKHSP